MSKSVYTSKRRQLLSNILTARRCKLDMVARRFQIELASVRIAAVA
jgi:hypothetical protein